MASEAMTAPKRKISVSKDVKTSDKKYEAMIERRNLAALRKALGC
ncbi:hypothetical protein [Martelella limonii]|nr:hypothetical protein [Martelella limonii]